MPYTGSSRGHTGFIHTKFTIFLEVVLENNINLQRYYSLFFLQLESDVFVKHYSPDGNKVTKMLSLGHCQGHRVIAIMISQ